jgi:hypothetical protein
VSGDHLGLSWRTASFCDEDACVEVAIEVDSVYVRNSRRPAQTPLVFDHSEWEAFVLGVRNHEFDVVPSRGGPGA